MNIQPVSDDELLARAHRSVKTERDAITQVIRDFQEIYDRKLYLRRGYPSFFEMVTKEFGYCPASAQLRINAMKLISCAPEVEHKLESGEMTLTVAANIQRFLNEERKLKRPYSETAKLELIEACTNKSVREVEREFAKRNPKIEKRDSVHFVTDERVRVSYSASAELEEKLDRLRALLSHQNPNMTREELFNQIAEIALDKLDPVRKLARAEKREMKKHATNPAKSDAKVVVSTSPMPENNAPLLRAHEVKRSRYISAQTKRLVIKANANQGCKYVDPKTNRCCGSKHLSQMDHLQPFAFGGTNDAKNLRLLCAQHNRLRWVESSGSTVFAPADPI